MNLGNKTANYDWMLSQDTTMHPYLESCYFSITVLTGLGDILRPEYATHIGFSLFCSVLGVAIIAFLINNIGTAVTTDSFTMDHEQHILNVSNFMGYNGVPRELQSRVISHVEHTWAQFRGADPTTVLEGLPGLFRDSLKAQLSKPVLEHCPILRGADEEQRLWLACHFSFESFPPREYIFEAGFIAHKLYFVSSGDVNLITGSDPKLRLPESQEIIAPPVHSTFKTLSKKGGADLLRTQYQAMHRKRTFVERSTGHLHRHVNSAKRLLSGRSLPLYKVLRTVRQGAVLGSEAFVQDEELVYRTSAVSATSCHFCVLDRASFAELTLQFPWVLYPHVL
jgi:CRP-like cAMP-binding protein